MSYFNSYRYGRSQFWPFGHFRVDRKGNPSTMQAFRKQMRKKCEFMHGVDTCKMSWMALSWVRALMNGRTTSRLRSDKRLATKSMGIAYATMIKKVGI